MFAGGFICALVSIKFSNNHYAHTGKDTDRTESEMPEGSTSRYGPDKNVFSDYDVCLTESVGLVSKSYVKR